MDYFIRINNRDGKAIFGPEAFLNMGVKNGLLVGLFESLYYYIQFSKSAKRINGPLRDFIRENRTPWGE